MLKKKKKLVKCFVLTYRKKKKTTLKSLWVHPKRLLAAGIEQ